jgi:three-Cys-motif partner protein
MTTADDIRIPYSPDALAEICERWRVRRLALYGDGLCRPLADDEKLDILYEFEPDASVGWEIFNLEGELSSLFGGLPVHMVEPRWMPARDRASALGSAIVVFAAPDVAPTIAEWQQEKWLRPEDVIFGGEWTQDKLRRVRKYLHAYTTILHDKPFKTAYIDAFAGTGYRAVRSPVHLDQLAFPELGEREPMGLRAGSARQALEIEPRFDKYILVEKSGARVDELVSLEGDFPELAKDIIRMQGDANTVLSDLCLNRRWSQHRAVLFLDPYGMQVDWQTIEAVAATEAIDMWLLFPLGVAVNRLLRKDGQIPDAWAARLDSLFGTETWRQTFYAASEQGGLFEEGLCATKTADFDAIGAFFVERLKTVFPGVADRPLALCNSKNVPLYLLCFAAANEKGAPTAVKIAQHILARG